MNSDLIFALLFYGLLFLFFATYRSKFEVQNKIFVLYKTKLGLNLMDKLSKKIPTFWKYLGYLGVIVGFLGMIIILYTLTLGTYKLIAVPDSQPALAPLLPGVQLPGLPQLTFWYWIISIFILAVIHEFSHGLYSRLYNVKVKSSGFAFLGPILAAFVEPDEKELEKKGKMAQLSVFCAGPFSNIILGGIVLVIYSLLLAPVASSINESTGVKIVVLQDGFPAKDSGMSIGEDIIAVNGIEVNSIDEFTSNLDNLKPGDKVIIETEKNNYGIEAGKNPNNNEQGYLGMSVQSVNQISKEVVEKYGKFLPGLFMWVFFLFFWLYVANIGVGLFNLLPLGPVDGGKIFYVGMLAIFKRRKTAMRLWNYMSFFVLILIFVNLLPWLSKLFFLIAKPFMMIG